MCHGPKIISFDLLSTYLALFTTFSNVWLRNIITSWCRRTYCHKIGYAPRVNKNNLDRGTTWCFKFEFKVLRRPVSQSLSLIFLILESSPDFFPETSGKKKPASTTPNKSSSNKYQKQGSANGFGGFGNTSHQKYGEGPSSLKSTPLSENIREDDSQTTTNMRHTNGSSYNGLTDMQIVTGSQSRVICRSHLWPICFWMG